MTAPFRFGAPVLLIGGGPVAPELLAAALALAPVVVGADGGGDVALPSGRDFAAVIGDMDSLRGAAALRARGVPVIEIAEQDSTDFEKCLASVAAPLILGLGFLGGRLDHQVAALNALVAHPDTPCVLIGGVDLCFLCPTDLVLDLAPGVRVSLFPMAAVRGVRCEGLRWSTAGLEMAPWGRIGTSNIATGGRMRLAFDRRAVLVILPVEMLGAVVVRLLTVPVGQMPLASGDDRGASGCSATQGGGGPE